MGTSLTGKQIKNTYKSLIKVSDNTEASASAKQLSDGNGNDFGVYIDTDGVFGIGSAPSYSLDVSSRTDGVALPVGTTANRPTGFNGLIRYNSTIGKVEFYDTGWKTIFTTSGGTISGSVTITGDLTVQGDNTIIEAQTVEVEDNILNLNRTQGSPDTATATTSGISIYRGDGVTEASFIFDDSDDTWDLTNNLVIAGTLQSSSYTDGTATLTGGTLSGAVLADGVTATTQANTDNSTKIATTAYVKSVVTLEDLDFAGGTGTGSVDLDSQTFTIAGTANEIETSASGQTLTIGLPDDVTITGDLTVDTNTLYVDSTNNRVGIGNTIPSSFFSTAQNLVIGTGSGSNGMTIYSESNAVGDIAFADATSDPAYYSGLIRYDHSLDAMRFFSSSTERMRLHSGGDISFRDGSANEAFYWDASAARLGIGAGSAPSEKLDIEGSGSNIAVLLNRSDAATSGSIKIESGNNTNNIYSTGSKDLTISTNSAERLRIDSSGKSTFYGDVTLSKAGTPILKVQDTTNNHYLFMAADDNNSFFRSDGTMLFQANFAATTNSMMFNGTGLGIGTDSPNTTLHIADPSSASTTFRISAQSNDENYAFIRHTDYTVNTSRLDFGTTYGYSTEVPAMSIFNGKVGIGTNFPHQKLTVDGLSYLGGDSAAPGVVIGTLSSVPFIQGYDPVGTNNTLAFYTGTSERMRIDSSGNVGINCTPSGSKFQVNQSADQQGISLGASFRGSSRILWEMSGTTNEAHTFIHHNGTDRYNMWSSSRDTHSFYTGNTERMRITSGGYLKASNTGSYYTTGIGHELRSSDTNNSLAIFSHTGASPYGVFMPFTNDPNNTTNTFFLASGGGTNRFVIYSNGNVANTNNTYTAISDAKLKENIVDATPKLDDLMQVKIRNYNLIGEETKQIGVVAQELEEIFPALVYEAPDIKRQEVPQLDEKGQEVLDENGDVVMTTEKVDLGTTTKSVKYSVFVPMLIKAMQEQQEIINDLKARIETLENQ